MSAFTIQLTAITLRLSAPPFEWSTTAIGAFSLLAVVGVALMPVTGRLADAGHAQTLITSGLALELAAWLLMLAAGSTILGLAAGVVALIVGQQAVMAATQSIVYDLRPEARSRINATFMALCFAGGAAGSALAGSLWPNYRLGRGLHCGDRPRCPWSHSATGDPRTLTEVTAPHQRSTYRKDTE